LVNANAMMKLKLRKSKGLKPVKRNHEKKGLLAKQRLKQYS